MKDTSIDSMFVDGGKGNVHEFAGHDVATATCVWSELNGWTELDFGNVLDCTIVVVADAAGVEVPAHMLRDNEPWEGGGK